MTEKRMDQQAHSGTPQHRTIPEVYMPAMPPLKLMEAIGRWIAARRRRRAIAQLSRLDDRLLQDLGLTRDGVLGTVKLHAPESRPSHHREPNAGRARTGVDAAPIRAGERPCRPTRRAGESCTVE